MTQAATGMDAARRTLIAKEATDQALEHRERWISDKDPRRGPYDRATVEHAAGHAAEAVFASMPGEEAIARALATVDGFDPDAVVALSISPPHPRAWEDYRKHARAVRALIEGVARG